MVSWAQISSGVCMTLAKLCWQLPRVACDSCHKKWVFSQSCYNSQQTFGGFPGTKCYERFFKSSYQRTTLKHTAKNQFCSVFGGKPNQAQLLIPLTGVRQLQDISFLPGSCPSGRWGPQKLCLCIYTFTYICWTQWVEDEGLWFSGWCGHFVSDLPCIYPHKQLAKEDIGFKALHDSETCSSTAELL